LKCILNIEVLLNIILIILKAKLIFLIVLFGGTHLVVIRPRRPRNIKYIVKPVV